MPVFARWFVLALAVLLPSAEAAAEVLDNFKFMETNYGIPGREFALAYVHEGDGSAALLASTDDKGHQVSVQFSTPEQWKTFKATWRAARAALVKAAKQGSTAGIHPWVYKDSGGNRMSILMLDQSPPTLSFLINQADGLSTSFTVKSEETMTKMDSAVSAISKRFGL